MEEALIEGFKHNSPELRDLYHSYSCTAAAAAAGHTDWTGGPVKERTSGLINYSN